MKRAEYSYAIYICNINLRHAGAINSNKLPNQLKDRSRWWSVRTITSDGGEGYSVL